MIIYLTGMSCVGKTTIGRMLATKLRYSFFDVDEEVEKYYQKPIERIQDECYTMNGFREKASVVLDNILSNADNTVISGTPSGLKFSFLQVYKKHKKKKAIVSIHIKDTPENILNRLTFYDKDSKPFEEYLDEPKKKSYLKEIIKDYNYFKDSYERADLQIDIKDICLKNIPNLIIKRLKEII
jgi:shikimate kinase